MFGYASQVAAQKRAEPGDDLASRLAARRGRRAAARRHGLRLFFLLLVDAGGDTTRNLVAGGIQALFEHPEERRRAAGRPRRPARPRDRGDAALGQPGRLHAPHARPRDTVLGGATSRPARRSSSTTARPTATRGLRRRGALPPRPARRTTTSPSAAARTPASARTSPGWRSPPCCARSSPGCPTSSRPARRRGRTPCSSSGRAPCPCGSHRRADLASRGVASTFDVRSSDGTVLRGWRNDGTGTPVVLANGLGTVPSAWPGLVAQRLRRRDLAPPRHVRLAAPGRPDAHPGRGPRRGPAGADGHRRAGARARRVAGRSGSTSPSPSPSSTRSGSPGCWRWPASPAARSTRWARRCGSRADCATRWPPRSPAAAGWSGRGSPGWRRTCRSAERLAWVLSHSGFMLPGADPQALVPMLREFLAQDWRWYGELALAASEHEPMDLSFVRCPTVLLAGRHDVLTSVQDVLDAAGPHRRRRRAGRAGQPLPHPRAPGGRAGRAGRARRPGRRRGPREHPPRRLARRGLRRLRRSRRRLGRRLLARAVAARPGQRHPGAAVAWRSSASASARCCACLRPAG